MNQGTHKQQHHGNEHEHKKTKAKAKAAPHRDWRFWTVIAMLVGIVIYVFTLDEELGPADREMPAAVAVDAAP